MKILKIFGLVVGIHVVAFMFVFAIPGCRSTSRHSPPPSEALQAERAPVHAAAATPIGDSDTLTSSPVSAGSPVDQSSNPTPVSSGSSALNFPTDGSGNPVIRANPTRPGSAAANNLQAPPPPTTTPSSTYVVVSGDNLWKIAKKHGLTSKEIAAANNLRTDAPLREGQKIMIPGKAIPHSTGSVVPTGNTAETLSYRVKSGETLAVIARHSGTTAAAIKSLNHLKSDSVHTGQELILPAGGAATSTLAAAPEDTASTGKGKNSGGLHHTVKAGETLGQIAKRYGVSRRDLAVANNIADPLKLRAGQDLTIPGKSAAPGTGATAKTTPAAPADTTTPATANNPASSNNSSPVSDSPIAAGPAPAADASPVAAPANPPVIQVQDSNPVSPAK